MNAAPLLLPLLLAVQDPAPTEPPPPAPDPAPVVEPAPAEAPDEPVDTDDPADPDPRFLTDRAGARALALTEEEPGFTFAIFGDRTGGPEEGVEVLRQAVADVNLLDPDLVMTVGDLVEGYNQRPQWMEQMREFRGIMDGLVCPWYPVAGNHDVYWRGDDRPPEEHEGDYEEHFGPLWYAVRHKGCWFLVLYSDEPDPATGVRDFNRPESQRMSPEQFAWLQATLRRTAGAEHVFVFLHHPRWLGGKYGDDWEKVHRALAEAGNVRAVFAGHIHLMRYDGVRDGIEYFTLATVGGHQNGHAARGGYLHQYHLVHVRPDGFAVSAYPVGEALDPRAITGAVSDEVRTLAGALTPTVTAQPDYAPERGTSGEYRLTWTNPTSRPVALEVAFDSADARWGFWPDHQRVVVAPGAAAEVATRAMRGAGPFDAGFHLPRATLTAVYRGEGLEVPLPLRALDLPLELGELPAPPQPPGEGVLMLDGVGAHLTVDSEALPLGERAPFTLECWLQPGDLRGRRGLLAKTESSEYGIFVSDGVPDFSVHLDGRYVSARATEPLAPDRWHHLAGVYDGKEVTLYLDGEPVASVAGAGVRTRNALPLVIGGDVNGQGAMTSPSAGRLDEVRLSRGARYAGRFTPERRHARDERTLLLLHMDADLGPWSYDDSPAHAHARRHGGARVELIGE